MAVATKAATTLVTAQTLTVGTPIRATIQLASQLGAFLTFKITNGATGPTAAATAKVMVAHNASLPAAAAEGVDWKTVYVIDGSSTANAQTPGSWNVPMGVANLQIEFANNTVQNCTVESYITVVSSIA